jgi:arginase family enzyme
MLTMLQEIQSYANVVGMDITEVNPDLGNPNGNERTAQITQYIISCIFGECKGGM